MYYTVYTIYNILYFENHKKNNQGIKTNDKHSSLLYKNGYFFLVYYNSYSININDLLIECLFDF